ncbi:meiotic recombination protein SPO11-like isoform X2 [Schistocerca gregaria]|uniref:meiotic recombination protein SPO11-like isoform X2 n=1 Tax=Schistocerca gregaria TaxID=7010 RepID=UPI00211F2059|nr:meiotic recombination protein SPO11-like isoform X2 [Schistocerca gregaria]
MSRIIKASCPSQKYYQIISLAQIKEFAKYVRVLEFIYSNLCTNVIRKKRDIYYSDAKLFQSQRCTDRIINAFASTFSIPTFRMNIISSEKGLIMGPLLIKTPCFSDDKRETVVLDCRSQPQLVPSPSDDLSFSIDTSCIPCESKTFVLVLEKETLFNLAVQENLTQKYNCILITGKGYPDEGTRYLVNLLTDHFPLYILTDADPHGINIFLTYSHGSRNYSYRDCLSASSAKWIGVELGEVSETNRINLNSSDLKLLSRLQSNPVVLMQPILQKCVQLMASRNQKAEAESFFSSQKFGFFSKHYLFSKLCSLSNSGAP